MTKKQRKPSKKTNPKPSAKKWEAFRAAMLAVLDEIGPELVARYKSRGNVTAGSLAASLGDAVLTHGPRSPKVYVENAAVRAWFESQPTKFQREAADKIARYWVELNWVLKNKEIE